MKQFIGSRKQTSNLVGGHIMQTLFWDTAKFLEKKHRVWQCDILKNINKRQRWETVEILQLCFCCLEEGHKVAECSWVSPCNIDKCLKMHNRMLHSANQEDELEQDSGQQSKISLMEGEEQQNTSYMATECQYWGVFHCGQCQILWKMGVKV